ncbi:MAG: AmmeMemoRadiSam system protein B [Anaerolineae bacterium]
MAVRLPVVAGMFYPSDAASCRTQIAQFLDAAKAVTLPSPVKGGIVPHAGWVYSGATAGRVFAVLGQQPAPETVVLFGAVHRWGVHGASVYGSGRWMTPLGALEIDEPLAAAVVDGATILNDPHAHDDEHSIEVQLPFVRYLFPEAHILPVAVSPSPSSPEVGRRVAAAAAGLGRAILALGSSDLTHYGPRYGMAPVGSGERALIWTRQNDARLLDLVCHMQADDVLAEASAHHNACGAGAIAATIGCTAALGATNGTLLQQTTSYDIMPSGPATDLVGYGAVVFS